MASYIIKRDGRREVFNKQKVMNAVKKAFLAVDGTLTKAGVKKIRRIGNEVARIVTKSTFPLSVEDIQDIVEELLMDTDRKDVARAYIVYRNERSKVRSRNTNLMKSIEEKLMATNVQNQNANLDEHSFGGRMGEARSELMKDYAINYLLSDMARNNHLNNEVYVHDLDSYAVGMHNCLTIPFDDLLLLQAMDLFPNFAIPNVELRVILDPAGLVWCPVNPQSVYDTKTFLEEEEIEFTLPNILFSHHFSNFHAESLRESPV